VNIHEYQAKKVLAGFGVPVPYGRVALSAEEAEAAALSLAGDTWVVKAQIHAGGRGKAGGVRICRSPDEVKAAAGALLGSVLVTHQTGPQGKQVHRLYIEQALHIAKEFYLALLVDRQHECISCMVCPDGGTDIEKIAADNPEQILHTPLTANASSRMAEFLGLDSQQSREFSRLTDQLLEAFRQRDASLIELNPLVLTRGGDLVALDAKMTFDDNALYRQPTISELRDPEEEDQREAEAAQFGLNFIQLDGNIGCMVNGAGLAMATMDVIQLKGAKPANFLDVGGGVTVEAVIEAFNLLLTDTQVKAVLVNIFGGIVRCDIIARGLLEAARIHELHVPVIMRLVGTHEKEGRQLIHDSGLNVQWAKDLDEAAELAAGAAVGMVA